MGVFSETRCSTRAIENRQRRCSFHLPWLIASIISKLRKYFMILQNKAIISIYIIAISFLFSTFAYNKCIKYRQNHELTLSLLTTFCRSLTNGNLHKVLSDVFSMYCLLTFECSCSAWFHSGLKQSRMHGRANTVLGVRRPQTIDLGRGGRD